MGGKARAEKLSDDERKKIASLGAQKRWGGVAVRATHVGQVIIGDRAMECAVLEDGRRVLTQETFLLAIGRSQKGKGGQVTSGPDGLPPFLSASALKSYIDNDLRDATVPVIYRTLTGRRAFGYEASLLPKVCKVYLKARDDGKLTVQQAHVAHACDILVRGLAEVGITALVDEATGYQEDRARDALAEILRTFISDELSRWVKTFPDEYFRQLFRLKRAEVSGVAARKPQWVGKITNNLIYERLAPGVKEELQRLTPKTAGGNRKHKFHQRLTPEHGHPRLREHLAAVIALMKGHDDWDEFKKMLDRSIPKQKAMPLFDEEE